MIEVFQEISDSLIDATFLSPHSIYKNFLNAVFQSVAPFFLSWKDGVHQKK